MYLLRDYLISYEVNVFHNSNVTELKHITWFRWSCDLKMAATMKGRMKKTTTLFIQ